MSALLWPHTIMQLPAGMIVDQAGGPPHPVFELRLHVRRERDAGHRPGPGVGDRRPDRHRPGNRDGVARDPEDAGDLGARRTGRRLPGVFRRPLLPGEHPGVPLYSRHRPGGVAMGVPDAGDPLFSAVALRAGLERRARCLGSAAPAAPAHREDAVGVASGDLPCRVVRIDAQLRQLGPFALGRGLARPHARRSLPGAAPWSCSSAAWGGSPGGSSSSGFLRTSSRTDRSSASACCSEGWR